MRKALTKLVTEIIIGLAMALITERLAGKLSALLEAKKLKNLEKINPELWKQLKEEHAEFNSEITFDEFLEIKKLETSLTC